MPTEDEFWKVAAQVAAERGGLVVGFTEDSDQPELGSTLDNVLGFRAPSSATVVRISDWVDWKEQVEHFYRLRPAWGRGGSGNPDAVYYRVKLSDLDALHRNPAPSSLTTLPSFDSRLAIPSFGGYSVPVGTFEGVSFWPRVFARGIDSIVHYLVKFIAGLLFIFLVATAAGGHPPVWILRRLSHTGFPLLFTSVFGYVAYQVISTTVYGSTLGKLLLSLQVVAEDGSSCRLKSAIIRELGFLVDGLFFGIIGYTAMKGDPRQQRHGDQWAYTVVRKRVRLPRQSGQGLMPFVLALMLGVGADIVFLMVGLLLQINW
jgi:uncharacterized RDD family membrane protein YckC